MNLPLLQPEKADVPVRYAAMLNALVQQRNQTADEVANLCGDLAEARERIATLEAEVEKLRAGSPA